MMLIKIDSLKEPLYFMSVHDARQWFPQIPFMVIDAVLDHGGSYNYGIYTITRTQLDNLSKTPRNSIKS